MYLSLSLSHTLSPECLLLQGCASLAEPLCQGRLPKLRELRLSFNEIGEQGTIALAQALLRPLEFLILNEATSTLDAESEK